MDATASYRHCSRLARRSASSFYWSFWLLPRDKRLAMCALYAFSRRADDLADSDEPIDVRRRNLDQWRTALEQALDGETDDPLLPALADAVQRFEIPREHLFAILDGVEMDLAPLRFETFGELREYCHRVASAVGLACVHIWGFAGPLETAAALDCGVAFQLTNILRDLAEDARRKRIYLPLEDLRRFEYGQEALLQGECDDRFRELMRFEIERTEQLYRNTAPLYASLTPEGRRSLGMMSSTYWRLLQEIRGREGDVFGNRVRLPLSRKLTIAAAHMLRPTPPIPEFLR